MNCMIQRLVLAYCVCLLPVASRAQQTASQPVGVEGVNHATTMQEANDRVRAGLDRYLEESLNWTFAEWRVRPTH